MDIGIDFLDSVTEKGVTERRFDLKAKQDVVPGILWTPEGAIGHRPLILLGHGGSQHKRIPNLLAYARSFVRHRGWACLAIDAPGHGDRRVAGEEPLLARAERTPEALREMGQRFKRAVEEWKVALDAAQQLDGIGPGPVGYWGVSMGTLIGLPLVASEPRVRGAVLGLAGLRENSGKRFTQSAHDLRIPVLLVYQRDDELVKIEHGLALFDAVGSPDKTMHINPGKHVEMPGFEREAAEDFFARHLTP